MIVVAIIAILAGILIPNFVNARSQAQTAACESNLRAIATAMELYYADNQVYPTASGAAVQPALLTVNGVAYLNNTPKDPAAQNGAATYSLTTTQATGGGPASYTIVCPGVHVGSTLAKIPLAGGTERHRVRRELQRHESRVRRRPGACRWRRDRRPFGDGLHAVAMRSPLAYPLVFAAGAVTSIGPCAAPRYVAVAALVSSARRAVARRRCVRRRAGRRVRRARLRGGHGGRAVVGVRRRVRRARGGLGHRRHRHAAARRRSRMRTRERACAARSESRRDVSARRVERVRRLAVLHAGRGGDRRAHHDERPRRRRRRAARARSRCGHALPRRRGGRAGLARSVRACGACAASHAPRDRRGQR